MGCCWRKRFTFWKGLPEKPVSVNAKLKCKMYSTFVKMLVNIEIERTGWCRALLYPHWWHSCILSTPVVVKQLRGPSLPKPMAQFNVDVDSGIIRISQFIYSIGPCVSQATLFSRALAVPVRIREGLAPSEIGTIYTFDILILGRPVAVKQLPGPSLPTTDGTV